jgi:hypothetical protein
VRRAVAIIISFLLGSPAFSASNYDYNSDRNNSPSYSYNSFDRNQQMAAYRVASFANQSYSIPMRPPVQFPRFNLDFTFHTTFSSPKLDLGRGSFSQPRFEARPVVSVDRNFLTSNNFKTTESPQVIQQTNVAVIRNDTVKVSDSVLSLNKNVDVGFDLKTKSITPSQQTSMPSQPIKGRVLDLVPPALGRFYGITDRQTPVAPQRTDATNHFERRRPPGSSMPLPARLNQFPLLSKASARKSVRLVKRFGIALFWATEQFNHLSSPMAVPWMEKSPSIEKMPLFLLPQGPFEQWAKLKTPKQARPLPRQKPR